jgi:hypothetical protein
MYYKIALLTGTILITIATILLLGNFLGDSTLPIFLGLLGILGIFALAFHS